MLGKVINVIIAKQIAFAAKKHSLLLITYIRRRKAIFTKTALHLLIKEIYAK